MVFLGSKWDLDSGDMLKHIFYSVHLRKTQLGIPIHIHQKKLLKSKETGMKTSILLFLRCLAWTMKDLMGNLVHKLLRKNLQKSIHQLHPMDM